MKPSCAVICWLTWDCPVLESSAELRERLPWSWALMLGQRLAPVMPYWARARSMF